MCGGSEVKMGCGPPTSNSTHRPPPLIQGAACPMFPDEAEAELEGWDDYGAAVEPGWLQPVLGGGGGEGAGAEAGGGAVRCEGGCLRKQKCKGTLTLFWGGCCTHGPSPPLPSSPFTLFSPPRPT